jgi:hypothetical protein
MQLTHTIKNLSALGMFMLLLACNGANKATSQPVSTVEVAKVASTPSTTNRFLGSLGIMATIPADHVIDASPNTFRMYSPDNAFEYFLTWEKNETPDRMKRAFKAGVDMGNGMFSRVIGNEVNMTTTSEAFDFGVYPFNDPTLFLNGYEIHDWSSDRGVLIVSVMCIKERATEVKEKALNLYQSIKILNKKEEAEMKAKVMQDRELNGRNIYEQKIYDYVVGKALISRQTSPDATSNSEERFELCTTGKGYYRYTNSSGVKAENDTMDGDWDIIEDENGNMLLVISMADGQRAKWPILKHRNGNVVVAGLEFTLASSGPDAPKMCGQ